MSLSWLTTRSHALRLRLGWRWRTAPGDGAGTWSVVKWLHHGFVLIAHGFRDYNGFPFHGRPETIKLTVEAKCNYGRLASAVACSMYLIFSNPWIGDLRDACATCCFLRHRCALPPPCHRRWGPIAPGAASRYSRTGRLIFYAAWGPLCHARRHSSSSLLWTLGGVGLVGAGGGGGRHGCVGLGFGLGLGFLKGFLKGLLKGFLKCFLKWLLHHTLLRRAAPPSTSTSTHPRFR